MKWFDREFPYDLPAWMAPNIAERLRGTPARLRARVAELSPKALKVRGDAQWSIQENIGHILDLEPLWFGRVDDVFEGQEYLREADLTNRKTHEADHNRDDIDGLLDRLTQARSAFVRRLESLTVEDVARSALHPRLKQPMRIVDLMHFVAEHDDHHLAQITRLHRELGIEPTVSR